MIYVHTSDKLFPKIQYRAFFEFVHETEPVSIDIEFSDIEAIENCQQRFIHLNNRMVNLNLAKQIWFETFIWGLNQAKVYSWVYLSDSLLKNILSDAGQTILLKRSMNVPD